MCPAEQLSTGREWMKLFADTQKAHKIIKRALFEYVHGVWSRYVKKINRPGPTYELYMGICTPSNLMALFSLLFYRSKRHRTIEQRTKRRCKERRQHKLYICVFKARPHIAARICEMQICPIVIGRTPHLPSPYMKKWVGCSVRFCCHIDFAFTIPFENQLNANPGKSDWQTIRARSSFARFSHQWTQNRST